ncbi:MAG: peptide deformylase [Nitrospinae bacterium]|nr:peptide deformylase [Nitrospinota bacterium]
MAILKVAQLGNPVLRLKAEAIPQDVIRSADAQSLIDDMIETMREYNGVGLAAPQVHESVQLIVVEADVNPRYKDAHSIPQTVIINPKIASFSDEMEEGWEGCLSLTDLWGKVRRAKNVRVTGLDRNAEPLTLDAEGFFARALQHEIDHLHGKVFIDRMKDLATLSFGKEYARYGHLHEEDGEAL